MAGYSVEALVACSVDSSVCWRAEHWVVHWAEQWAAKLVAAKADLKDVLLVAHWAACSADGSVARTVVCWAVGKAEL